MSFCTCLNTFFGAGAAGTTPTSKTQQQEAQGGRTPTTTTAPKALELTRTPRVPHDLEMRSPKVQVTNNTNIVSGKGIVLASLALEQDSAYWQVKCLKPGQFSLGVSRALDAKALAEDNLMWGVGIGMAAATGATGEAGAGATAAEDGEEETKEEKKIVTAEAGDVFGLAFDQCSFPMLRFYKNGIELEGHAINRVRGLVFPAIQCHGQNEELVFLFHQDDWAYPPPSSKLSMILQSRNMM